MTVAVEPHDVTSTMQFIRPDSTINRRYIIPGKEVNTGKYEVKQVDIKDARRQQDEYTLDKSGFQLFTHETTVTNFADPSEVEKYSKEIEEFIKQVTGAYKVISYAPIIRITNPEAGAKEQPPAADVHCDVTTPQAIQAARRMNPDEEYSRFLHMSNWRAFSNPPQDFPLGVVDYRSTDDRDGLTNTAIWADTMPDGVEGMSPEELPPLPTENARVGEAFVFPYKENYEWRYFSNMTKDELLSFKLHDSDHSRAWRTPHCAFQNDLEGGIPRESIEVRTCCYFK